MTSPKKLILFSSAFLAITFLISALLFYLDVLSKDDFKAFLLAGIITAFNTGLGIISIKSVINKPESVFIQRLFGGMVIGFCIMLWMETTSILNLLGKYIFLTSNF